MGRMSVKLFIQCIDFGWLEAGKHLDESPFDSRGIDLVRCIRFVTKDHVFDSQDSGGTEGLFPSYFGHPLLRQREWVR